MGSLLSYLEKADENKLFLVCHYTTGTEIARYDGRDSIPTELNDRVVLRLKDYEDCTVAYI